MKTGFRTGWKLSSGSNERQVKICVASEDFSINIFTLMPKAIARNKTRKSVAKRFKITATGKALRNSAGRRHLLSNKNAKKKRQLAKSRVVDPTDMDRVLLNMPFG
ncbi:MAG: 50S ribosomal protein L35 [Verrucomicrobiales bacterium]